jgi:voltage-gated potassium channel Kch
VIDQVLLGTSVLIPMIVFHVVILVLLASYTDRKKDSTLFGSRFISKSALLGTSVLVILLIHFFEAWIWAVIYFVIGEFTDLGQATYFSVVTATTLGYGDITLSEKWQLLASIEAMGGLILFGASTAYLIEVMRYFFTENRE